MERRTNLRKRIRRRVRQARRSSGSAAIGAAAGPGLAAVAACQAVGAGQLVGPDGLADAVHHRARLNVTVAVHEWLISSAERGNSATLLGRRHPGGA